jgi:phospholipase D-like protein
MILFDGVGGLIFLALWIFCIIDVITTPQDRCRNLPKIVWLLIVILLIDVGSIAWLVAGRTWDGRAGQQRIGATTPRTRTKAAAGNPDDDDAFLATLRARAEEQRRRARDGQQGGPEDGTSSTS